MKRIAPAALVVLASAAGPVLAQDTGFYAGLSAGQSSADVDGNGLQVIGATQSSLSISDTDTGYKVYGGYRFHRNFAVEAGWADLGSFSATRTVTAPIRGSVKAETSASGLYGQIVGIIPEKRGFSFFGTAGVYANEVQTTISTTGPITVLGGTSRSHSDVNVKLGIGAAYDFTERFSLRFEMERFFDLGDDSVGGKSDVDLVSLGVVIRF